MVELPGTCFPRQWVTLRDLALKGKTSWWKKAEASQRFGPCHRWAYPVRRTLASAVSLSTDVPMGRELADLELGVSFPCFPDVVTIWSSVSKHVQQWLLQRKVGSYPTPPVAETASGVLAALCQQVPLFFPDLPTNVPKTSLSVNRDA